MEGHHQQDGSPAHTFDRIAEGSRTLLLSLRRKHVDIGVALAEGDFVATQAILGTMHQLIGPLAQAQAVLGYIGEGYLCSPDHIEVGMVIAERGEITEIREEPCAAHGEACGNVAKMAVFADGRQLHLMDGADLVVVRADDDKPS